MSTIAQFRRTVARARELRRLDRARHPQPEGCELVALDKDKAVWCVPVPGQEDRFMSVKFGGHDSKTFVVQVDTELFYRTWLADPSARGERNSADCVLRSEMSADYKYLRAAGGFSHGRDKPVPLAEVGARRVGGKVRIGFINGITRTFWLIANRAPAFPVEVYDRETADLLYHATGFGLAPACYGTMFAASGG